MSVFVKGMDMPKNCGCCQLRFTKWCEARIYMETRPTGCPLVDVPTPHGRLIDADELKLRKYHSCVAKENAVAVAHIDWSPTVIEAEK